MAGGLQAQGNSFLGSLSNVGASFQGSNISVGRDFILNTGASPETKRQDCLAALFLTHPRDDREKHITFKGEITAGTCGWIKGIKAYREWKNDVEAGTRLLWVSGSAGMGKTMLSIYLTQELENSIGDASERILLYYFCDGQDDKRNTATAILRGLIFQLLEKKPSLTDHLLKPWQTQKNGLFRSIESLWHVFGTLVKECGLQRVYCLIDAADECDIGSLHHFLKKLSMFFLRAEKDTKQHQAQQQLNAQSNKTSIRPQSTKAKHTALRMMIVSREEPRCLLEELSKFPRIRLVPTELETPSSEVDSTVAKALNTDLKTVIAAKAQEISDRSGASVGTAASVARAFEEKGDGSLLWVSVAAEKLKNSAPTRVDVELQELPVDAAEMYCQSLRKVPSAWTPYVAALLKCVALATRPLKVQELEVLLTMLTGASVMSGQVRQMVKLCESLLSECDQEILLAHQTVKSLLVDPSSRLARDRHLASYFVFEAAAHAELANACIEYLGQGGLAFRGPYGKSLGLSSSLHVAKADGSQLSPGERNYLLRFPFLNYAVLNWPDHARRADPRYLNCRSPFFGVNSPVRQVWWETHWVSTRRKVAWRWTTPKSLSILHIACFFGVVPLALQVERQGELWQQMAQRDSHGMQPLHYSLEQTQPAMNRFLIERGVLNLPKDRYAKYDPTPLEFAVTYGDAETLEVLLRSGGSPNEIDTMVLNFSGVASMGAFAARFLPRVVTILANEMAEDTEEHNLGFKHGDCQSLLHNAAHLGWVEVTEVLLRWGADPHIETSNGWRPIHVAAFCGRLAVMDALIKAGANVCVENKGLYTPLHYAARESNTECVIRLLDLDARAEAKTKKGKTPLHAACSTDNVVIVELLLAAGAGIETRCNKGFTPLLTAVDAGKDAVVECLLTYGADVHAKWQPSPVDVAIDTVELARRKGHPSTVTLLQNFLTARVNGTSNWVVKPIPVRIRKPSTGSAEQPRVQSSNGKFDRAPEKDRSPGTSPAFVFTPSPPSPPAASTSSFRHSSPPSTDSSTHISLNTPQSTPRDSPPSSTPPYASPPPPPIPVPRLPPRPPSSPAPTAGPPPPRLPPRPPASPQPHHNSFSGYPTHPPPLQYTPPPSTFTPPHTAWAAYPPHANVSTSPPVGPNNHLFVPGPPQAYGKPMRKSRSFIDLSIMGVKLF